MTMSRVHYNNVDTSLNQCRDTLFSATPGTNCCAYSQTALIIFTGIGVLGSFLDVFDSN